MNDFAANRSLLGSHELAELTDAAHGRRVRIARRGATVVSMEVTHAGRTHDLADGYRDAAELDTRPGSRFAVMAPFANRIADARYRFDGVEHDLAPGVRAGERAARHGFVRGVDFLLDELHADEHGAQALFTTQAIRPGVHPGYPHAIDLSVRYTLTAAGLDLEVRMRNAGTGAAPCFFGWHPYFRVGDTPVDSWELALPAATLIRTDAGYIPLPGDAARVPVGEEPAKDFRRPRAIGAVKLDQAYADQARDADGRIRTHLRDPASGLGLAMWQERGVTLVFTADTVARDARRAVALEPMESWSDAFNRADCAAAIRLEAGAERTYRCGVEFHTR